ncbi:hypothetical protein ACOME3_005229 [Neoechinorhynchus agilis]
MKRFELLEGVDKKLLENEEDSLLTGLLSNLISFMVMMRVNKDDLRRRVRRLIGRTRLALNYSQLLYDRLDLQLMNNNLTDDSNPIYSVGTRHKNSLMTRIFAISDSRKCRLDLARESILIFFIDDLDDSSVLSDRIWYDHLVSLNFSSMTKTISIWWRCIGRMGNAEIKMRDIIVKKGADVYHQIRSALDEYHQRQMKNAKAPIIIREDVEGLQYKPEDILKKTKYDIYDLENGWEGTIQFWTNGIDIEYGVVHADEISYQKKFVDIGDIDKISQVGDNILVIAFFDKECSSTRKLSYRTDEVEEICFTFMSICSINVTRSHSLKSETYDHDEINE